MQEITWDHNDRRRLRQELTTLLVHPDSGRMYAEAAGLDPTRIDLSGSAEIVAYHIVSEADKCCTLAELQEVILKANVLQDSLLGMP